MNRNDKANYIVVDDLEDDTNITPEQQEEFKRNYAKFIEYYFPKGIERQININMQFKRNVNGTTTNNLPSQRQKG